MSRTRQQLDEETQCPYCSGSGIDSYYGYRCHRCDGSGLCKPPKFRVTCECGQRQPRWASSFTVQKWMWEHLASHAPEDPEDDSGGVGTGEEPK